MGIEPITITLQIVISKLYQLYQVFKFYSKKGFLVRFVESALNICPKPKRTVLIKLKPNSIGIKPISRHWNGEAATSVDIFRFGLMWELNPQFPLSNLTLIL